MGSELDFPLTPKGIQQVEKTGKIIQNISFDYIFCSPNQRAIDTANIIFPTQNYTIENNLKEQSFGDMTGKTISAIPKHIDAEYFKDPFNHKHTNGESFKDLIFRVRLFMQSLESKSGKILLITHCNVIRAAIAYMKNPYLEAQHLNINNAKLSKFTFQNQKYHCNFINL